MPISPISGNLPYDNLSSMPALQASKDAAAATAAQSSTSASQAGGSSAAPAGSSSSSATASTPPPAKITSSGSADSTFANFGSVSVTDASGKSQTFNVKAGESVSDLAAQINKSGLGVTASVNSSGQFQLTAKPAAGSSSGASTTGSSSSSPSTIKLSSDSAAVMSQLGGFQSSSSAQGSQTASTTSVSATSAAPSAPAASPPAPQPNSPQAPAAPQPGGSMFAAQAMAQASESLLNLFNNK